MTRKNKHGLIILFTLLFLASFISGCSLEPRAGAPADTRLIYMVISTAMLLVFAVVLVFLAIKNIQIRKKHKNQAAILSSIYDILPDLVFVKDKNGAYTSCNRSFEQLHGLPEQEIIGKTSADIVPMDFYENRGLVQQIKDLDDIVIKEKKPVKRQGWRTYPDGTKRFLETIRVPLFEGGEVTGMLGIARDLTELRTLLEQYENQATTFSAIYNNAIDTIFSKDKNGVYTNCNHVFAKLHGCSIAEIVGKSARELYRDKDQIHQIMDSDNTVINEKRLVREQAWITFDNGAYRFFETMKVPLIQDDEVTGLLAIGRDMTEFKTLLEQYKDQATTLSAIYDALPDIVFSKNKENVYTSCNDAFQKIVRREKSEIIGKTSLDIFPVREQAQCFLNADSIVYNEKRITTDQMWVTYPDGITRYVETIKAPLIQEDEVTGLLGIGRDMTELKTMLDEISNTHKITELMLDTIPFCCILINKEHKCFACNNEATRLFRLKSKLEFIEQYTNLSPKYQPDGWLSSKLAQVYFEKAFDEGKCSFEWMHKLFDGTLIPAQLTLVRVAYNNDYAIIAYVRDMREHVQMVDEIEKQNTLLKTLNHVSAMLLDPDTDAFEKNLFDSMFIIAEALDVDRVSIWRNYTRGERLYCTLAYEWLSDLVSGGGSDVMPDISYTDNIPGCEESLSKGKCLNIMVRNTKTETDPSPCEVLSAFAVPVFVRDRFWGFVAFDDRLNEHKFVKNEELILRSISRMIACTLIRNEMAQNIRTTETQLKIMVDEAHKASNAKSDFLAKMSHEIRTPMNAIAGMAELALREKELDTTRRHILTIKQASANLLSIINDILDITKIESGKMEIISDYYLFSSLMNDVISIIKMKLIDSQLRFTVNIDCSIPNELCGDVTRIRQVLINLLSNAVKYTDEGFVSFIVTGTILEGDVVNLDIIVKDSGRGIKQEDINKLFVDFSQLDTEKNRSIEGTGLGLAISWNILKAMGGDIKVSSEYGKGSTFTATLPQAFHSSHCHKLAYVKNPAEKSVLVYERRDIYANSIIATLENLGVRCELASGGTSFRKKLATRSFSFIFLAPILYEHSKNEISQFAASSNIVMLTEFGETPTNDDFSILAMPAHCISVANILNGVPEVYSYKENELFSSFVAPDARVLVVDDIRTNLTVTEGLLLPYKMHVDLCKSGMEAIIAIKSNRYDLVFMDHWMIEMDGVEATKCIRALGEEDNYYMDIPIIALTANAIFGTRDMFIKNGFNDFLAKPIDTVKLNSILERWIPRKKQQKSAMPHEGDVVEYASDAASMAIPEIKGLNINKGIALTGGSVKRYLETLDVFYDDGLEKVKSLKTCLETGNISLYTIHIHALKSAAANVGAETLSLAAKDLEVAGKQTDLSFIEAHSAQFFASLESLLANVHDALLVCRGNAKSAVISHDTDVLKTKLAELRVSLETLDAHAMNSSIEALLDMRLPEDASAVVQSISKSILLAEYDEALTLTESLLGKLGLQILPPYHIPPNFENS